MQNVKAALIWIADILKKYEIPFQISGGLAAIAYGANRPIVDIDVDIKKILAREVDLTDIDQIENEGIK